MVDRKTTPFAKLDTSLLRSTREEAIETLTHQHASEPVSQPPSKTANQLGGRPVSQDVGTPAAQETGTPVNQLVKATFYLAPEHVMQLERLRLERLQRGQKIDKSALVREAIDHLMRE